MINILKQKKVLVIVGICIFALIGWKAYNHNNTYEFIETKEIKEGTSENEKEIENKEIIIIHIAGEVKIPGIVKIEKGSRIQDVIEKAGGLTENADITNVNLAYVVDDGIKIRIPSVNDEELGIRNKYITDEAGKDVVISNELDDTSKDICVNINTANELELQKLPGIGVSIAKEIIEYRNKNGKFKTIEDIKNVTGIGDSKFEKIKDYIKV